MFDSYPVYSSTITDLSRVLFEHEYMPEAFARGFPKQKEMSYEERLASCRMIVSTDDHTPTITGLLAIGTRPQDFLPGAYIQFLRIDGTELADDVIDETAITGGLLEQLRRTDEKLKAHNYSKLDAVSSATHIRTTLYPRAAWLQILYNAVLHRSYESSNAPTRVYWFNDRIEISSPGGPYGNVTAENFGKPGVTDYRNPNLAGAMKVYGLVQTFGRGIAIAEREMERNGNPPLEFEVNSSSVLCILKGK